MYIIIGQRIIIKELCYLCGKPLCCVASVKMDDLEAKDITFCHTSLDNPMIPCIGLRAYILHEAIYLVHILVLHVEAR